MAYTSFTLRKANVSAGNGGSALRRTNYTQSSSTPSGSGTAAYDSALKSDNFVVAVPAEYLNSSFVANVFQRDRVELAWQLDTALVSAPSPAGGFDPTTITICASNDGEPTTPQDGFFVVQVTANNYFETYTDIATLQRTYIAEGRWVYYSMFVLYADDAGEQYYERVATLSVQIPYDFGSTEQLWRHVPTYYRELDGSYAQNTEYDNGPLYRFIELFGWELDKMRTTVYDTMRINDPQVIHSSAINALANQMGLEFNKDILGTSKVRAVLDNIGYLRRTKGTLNSVESYISALSGCGVSVNSSATPIVFNVHPHRVNLFTDPQFLNASNYSQSAAPKFKEFTNLNESGRQYGWGVYIDYGSGSVTPTVTSTGETLTITIPPKSGTATVLIYSRGSFAYNNNLVYYASAESSHNFVPRFLEASNLHNYIESAGNIFLGYADNWNDSVPYASFPKLSHPTRKVVGTIPKTTTPSAMTVIPMFKFDVTLSASASTVITFKKPLFEYRHTSADYFDGDNPLGGFIPTAAGGASGQYDFHWGPNAVSTSGQHFSYYTSDYYRSKEVTNNIIADYVVPITVSGADYTINWDVLE